MKGRISIMIFAVLLWISLFVSSTYNNEINYGSIKTIESEDFKRIYIKPELTTVIHRITVEKIEKEFIERNDLFPYNESWIMKKYDKENLYTTTLDKDDFPDIYIENEMVFPSVNALLVDEKKYMGVVFNDKFNNLITLGSNMPIYAYNKEDKSFNVMMEIQGPKEFEDEHRLLDAKGELLFVAGWENEYRVVPMYAYTKLYKFDLKEKQVEVFDSYPYGIFIYSFDTREGYPPNYDISKDRRYFYIPGVQDHEYSNIAYIFDRENVKVQGGLYVYDCWENRLYKLVDGTVSDVTNNTDDGYVYYKVRIFDNKKSEAKEWYYRFKNPEEMLKQITE